MFMSTILWFCFISRSLGCPRVTIHKNLFVSFILCGIMWIVYFAAVVSNRNTLAEDKVSQCALFSLKLANRNISIFQRLMGIENYFRLSLTIPFKFTVNSNVSYNVLLICFSVHIDLMMSFNIMILINKNQSFLTKRKDLSLITSGKRLKTLKINLFHVNNQSVNICFSYFNQ